MKKLLFMMLWLTAVFTACGGGAGGGDPVTAVETYLQAKVEGDGETVRSLLCSEMEQFVDRESHAFDSVTDVTIEGMACTEGGDGRVTCSGTIKALYGAEETEFPLTNYKVVQEDGEWKWCGETE